MDGTIGKIVTVNEIEFVFMSEGGTIDTLFIFRLQEGYCHKVKKLYVL